MSDELRRLAGLVAKAYRAGDGCDHMLASRDLSDYLAAHPEPAQPDAVAMWANRGDKPEEWEKELGGGVQPCGCQPARSFVCPPHQIAALEAEVDALASLFSAREKHLADARAERDAAQSEARHHADRCAALVAEASSARMRIEALEQECDILRAQRDGFEARAVELELATPAAPGTDSRATGTEVPAKGGEGGPLNPAPLPPARDAATERADAVAYLREWSDASARSNPGESMLTRSIAAKFARGSHEGAAIRRAEIDHK